MLDVLHVIPFLWSGAGRVLTRLCERQAGRLRVGMVTSARARGERDWPDYRRTLARAGVSHSRIDFFSRDPESFWTGARQLANLIDRERPAVVHTHAGVPAAAAAIARGWTAHEFRIVAQFYSWGLGRPAWMDDMDLWGFAHADRVVCSAEAYRRRLVEGGVDRRRICLVPWGVDVTDGRPEPARGTLRPVIGFVGRIEPRKRQLELVRVVAALRKRQPDLCLELVGPTADAEYEQAIRAEVARRGLGPAVRLLGKVRDPLAHVSGWDLFVSLSSDEGQGMAVLEAMELGTPVAAQTVAGVEDVVSRGAHAFPIDPRAGTAAIAARLRDLLADPVRLARAGRLGRAFVHARYSWDTTDARINAAYRHR